MIGRMRPGASFLYLNFMQKTNLCHKFHGNIGKYGFFEAVFFRFFIGNFRSATAANYSCFVGSQRYPFALVSFVERYPVNCHIPNISTLGEIWIMGTRG